MGKRLVVDDGPAVLVHIAGADNPAHLANLGAALHDVDVNYLDMSQIYKIGPNELYFYGDVIKTEKGGRVDRTLSAAEYQAALKGTAATAFTASSGVSSSASRVSD